TPGEIAVGKAQTGNRAAEAYLAGALDVEAGLKRQAADRGAKAVAVGPQRTGRQNHIAAWSVAAGLDVTRDRAVGVDAAIAGRAVEAGVGEVLAGNEMPG